MSTKYEKLGAFYLGKGYDMAAGECNDNLVLYDSKDLTTHGVCFGMTGSGKTGLSVCLLEEALMDGIPVIAIDPKGDLANLLLTFPNLSPQEFEPWVSQSAARQAGQTTAEYAKTMSTLWQNGLSDWGQSAARVQALKSKADFAIYTPGSEAGLQVSMLQSFDAPSPELAADRELLVERIQATVSSLLALIGIDSDPLQSREHILLSTILDTAWSQGQSLALTDLIPQVATPPFEKVGLFDIEAIYPQADRMKLAMTLNNLLVSPSFQSWMNGEPLDIDRMLYTAEGKPRISIFSIAHLGDAERMFFVTALLGQMVSWMRRQSGSASLRALLYMDEIYGFFPPTANPPSKQPLMTLLKQARAFGLGVLVATQNPKDLDYKGLSNMGTWFVGRLQTDRDQERVLDGLEGAAAGTGAPFDRGEMQATLAGLGKRVFLKYNVHEAGPEIFHTRWALSYLSGPMTREQIKRLMDPKKSGRSIELESLAVAPAPVAAPKTTKAVAAKPALPKDIKQLYAPVRSAPPDDAATLVYEPMLIGVATVQYIDARAKIDHEQDIFVVTPIEEELAPAVDWERADDLDLEPSDLSRRPDGTVTPEYGELAGDAKKLASYKAWQRKFTNWIAAERRLNLFKSEAFKITSNPAESEREFRIRLEELVRDERDLRLEKLRKKYAPKIARLEERIRKAELRVGREADQAKTAKMQSTIQIGATLIGALFGRKMVSATNVRRAGSAMRSVSRASQQSSDIDRANADVAKYSDDLRDLEMQFEDETDNLASTVEAAAEDLQQVSLRPKKTNIRVKLVSLAWLPYWKSGNDERPAWR